MARGLVWVLVAVVLALGGVVLGGGALLNSGPVRARIVAGAERATGHPVRIDGRIGIAWSTWPIVAADDVELLNPPGLSRADFARVGRITAQIDLWPLLRGRIVVRSLTLEKPDVLLERDGAGRGNWLPSLAGGGGKVSVPRPRRSAEIADIRIEDGTVAWKGGPVLSILSVLLVPAGGPISGTVVLNGVPFALAGQSGRISSRPFQLELVANGQQGRSSDLHFEVSGQVGGTLDVHAAAADLSTASDLVGRALPPVQAVNFVAALGADGLTEVQVTADDSDLGMLIPGLRIGQLKFSAPASDQPAQLLVQATIGALPMAVAVHMDQFSALLGGGPIALEALARADGGSVSAVGRVDDLRGRGLAATISAQVVDLHQLAARAGLKLPMVLDGNLDVHVLALPGGDGVMLRGLRATMQQGDVAGDLAVGFGAVPWVRGSLVSQRLDLDGWKPVIAAVPAQTAPAVGQAEPVRRTRRPWVSARKLPFAMLRRGNLDVRLSIGQMRYHGTPYRDVAARMLLQDGVLRLDPMQVVAPGGMMQGQFSADATSSPPEAALTLLGAGLDAGGVSAALGAPGVVTGLLDVDLALRAKGADLAAMAGTLNGHVGVALVDGEVENEVLAGLLAHVLREANLPVDLNGQSQVRCFAAWVNAADGQASIATLALDTTKLRLTGDGVVDLSDRTVDLHLRPVVRVGGSLGALFGGGAGGAGVTVPVRVSGPMEAPKVEADKGVVAKGRFGISIGAVAPDPCGPALSAARAGRAGAMP